MSDFKEFFSGAIAGLMSRIVIAPFDMLKIRIQLGDNSSKNGFMKLFGDIIRKEGGLIALWKGNMPGVYLYVFYGGIQFPLQKKMAPHVGDGLAGAAASSITTIITYPLDLLRTRRTLILQNGSVYGNNIFSMAKRIILTENTPLFKGMGVGVLQVAPAMGGKIDSIPTTDLIGGLTAGFISKLCMMPLEVVRRHLQIENLHYMKTLPEGIKKSPDSLKTTAMIRWIYKEKGGIPAFYRGLSLALLKSISSTGIMFMVYGIINRW